MYKIHRLNNISKYGTDLLTDAYELSDTPEGAAGILVRSADMHDMAFDPAAEADDDSAFQSPANYLEDHRYGPARQLEDADWSDNSNHNLHEALEVLDDRSRDILYQRWLAEEKATLHDLAQKYNVSAERIRQLEKSAMNKLKLSIAA